MADYYDSTALPSDENLENVENVQLQESIVKLRATIFKAPKKADRVVGQKYIYKGEVRTWSGKDWNCEHNKRRDRCKDCGGVGICPHKRRRSRCKHCGGTDICEHGRIREQCIECGGSTICEHGRRRSQCKECGGGAICEHDRIRGGCRECGGSQICPHDKIRSTCRECEGSQFCPHDKIRYTCAECGGSGICTHKIMRRSCKECDPNGYLKQLMRSRVYQALKRCSNPKTKRTMEYVGCDVETLREHLEKQFLPGMTWENKGKWHIDHRKPCAVFDLNKEEERHQCFHYTNLQPMWASDNISKSDYHDEASFPYVWDEETGCWKDRIL